jgi:hypothetical protein
MICDPVRAALVLCTLLIGEDTMAPEAVVNGLGLMSCDVVMEIPFGTSAISGPIVKPVNVTVVCVLTGILPDVMVSMMLVVVGIALVALKPVAITTVGVEVDEKNPLG